LSEGRQNHFVLFYSIVVKPTNFTTGTPFSFSAAMKNIAFVVYAIQQCTKTLEGPEI